MKLCVYLVNINSNYRHLFKHQINFRFMCAWFTYNGFLFKVLNSICVLVCIVHDTLMSGNCSKNMNSGK